MEPNDRLELFFSQSLDGFFFMMLDEPVVWNDSIDKEKALDYIFEHQRVTKVNDAMLAQYRTSREEFLGTTPADPRPQGSTARSHTPAGNTTQLRRYSPSARRQCPGC